MRGSFTVILLEYLQTTEAVAEYRAVLPFAKLNFLVLESFAFLFIPLAARIFARGDRTGMNALYWQTTVWTAVLSFPVFAVMFALARPVTILLFGAEYATAAPVLSLLALGYYFHAALGFSHHILRVCGRVRYVFTIDVITILIGLALHLLLIPRYGALGAAVGTTATFVLHKLLGQLGLAIADTGVVPVERRYMKVYLLILVLASGLFLLQQALQPPLYIGLVVAAMLWLVLLNATRYLMSIEETLPELMRIPLMRRFLS
jgi:O-antigen/teichoic acid export membrane protein